jgi:hypothetical protein
LADALVSEASVARHEGSTPSFRTKIKGDRSIYFFLNKGTCPLLFLLRVYLSILFTNHFVVCLNALKTKTVILFPIGKRSSLYC